jgi:hypothetical protein
MNSCDTGIRRDKIGYYSVSGDVILDVQLENTRLINFALKLFE